MDLPGNFLLPAILFVTIGFIVGALVATLFQDRSQDREEAKEQPAQNQPASAEPYTGLPPERFDPLARLYREKSTGKLVTEVERKIYLTPESVPADHLRKLRAAAESWNMWLGVHPVQPPMPVSSEPLVTVAPFTPEPAVIAAVAEKPRGSTMVEQIDGLIQEMLPGTPLAGRAIRLKQEPSLGVVVWVDAHKFIGVDAVPDPEVQALVRAAVKKWEATGDLSLR
jgi:hypothetical protein